MTDIGDRLAALARLVVLCVCWPIAVVGALSAVVAQPCPSGETPVPSDELRRPAGPCYDVVALRVEFQPDTTRFTTGDGTFAGNLFGGLEPSVDPLPHDAAYFEAHLDFLKDYVGRVSDGQTVVRTHLVPDVVRVPKRMGAYAPTGVEANGDEERAKLAALVHDAWTAADAQSNFDMSGFAPERTALAIFHAGVGRDIELIGLTLEKTPEDLPSIFFGEETLRRLGAAGASFNGFPISHSMIIPRTETRRGTDFIADQPFLLELSINGMLAASFFNFLGVPDLFDVESGESAIGPFGLMDAQGIFAYGGLFPPEPMAWTKYYLGWTDPLDLTGPGPRETKLRAMSLPESSESARALISDAEYFLVENRFRDPEGDGLTLRVWKDGEIVQQHVQNGDETFNNVVQEGFVGGVVVGVDNYDWALPGGLDEDDNELNGGLLVWHVDERRLREGLAENAVNVAGRRAVDLEEADGAQDIGFPSDNPFAPRADLGTPFDFFYEGNPVFVETASGREIRLYENRFGPDTVPSSETNAGGPSFIVLDDFSEPGAQMSFTYRQQGVAGIEPVVSDTLAALQEALRSSGVSLDAGSSITTAGGATLVFDRDASTVYVARSSVTAYQSLAHPVVDDVLVRMHATEDGRAFSGLELATGEELWSTPLPAEVAGHQPISPIVRSINRYFVIMEGEGGRALVSSTEHEASLWPTPSIGEPLRLAVVDGERLLVVGTEGAGYSGSDRTWTYQLDSRLGQPVVGRDSGGTMAVLPLPETATLRLLRSDGTVQDVDVAAYAARFGHSAHEQMSAYPVVADLDGDDRIDVLVSYGPVLFAFTQAGAVVDGFPIEVGAHAAGRPLVVVLGGGKIGMLAPGLDGYMHGYSVGGRPLDGFPLEVGTAVPSAPVVEDGHILAVSEGGTVKSWRWPDLESVEWGRIYADAGNSSLAATVIFEEIPERDPLIEPSDTYNWPNPIEDEVTHLRIRTSRDARVTVTIVDGGGSLVREIDMGVIRGDIPTEVVWQLDGVQSGLYFARFTATTADGERETKLVKMAVIR